MGKALLDRAGITLIELMVTLAILSILAVGIMPLSQMTYKRTREMELKHNLRVVREALDRHKKLADEKKISLDAADSGYPENLDVLVHGVTVQANGESRTVKFLRRIPKDPMTDDGEWGLRSYFDEPDSEIWGGEDVYDIYSKSDKQALDGSYYNEW